MPIFHYHCRKCGKNFDLFQRITDDPLKNCSYCGGRADLMEQPLHSPAPASPPLIIRKAKALNMNRASKKVAVKVKKKAAKRKRSGKKR